jgi:hypothetical protein
VRRPLFRKPHTLVLCTCLLSAGCGTDTNNTGPDAALAECTGNVTVEVSSGTQPTITWAPKCRLFILVVESAATGHDSWSITSPGLNAIAPDVMYGRAPPSSQEAHVATALVPGQVYTVALRRFTSPGNEDGILIGAKDFTP